MKILSALLLGLVIGLCLGWRFGPHHQNAKPQFGAVSASNTLTFANALATSLAEGSMLDAFECQDKVVLDGIDNLILPKEVESLFGPTNVDHFISNFGGSPPIWNSVAYFAGRYMFALQVPIAIDYKQCKFAGALNSAQIQINETIKVDISTSGGAGATHKGQWRLSENEWKWLVKNNGDWSVVKVPILTNSPVKDFDEFVRQTRAPIRDRKEDFDKPVKEALELLHKLQSASSTNAMK